MYKEKQMKFCNVKWPIGICSWSLQKDVQGIAEVMNSTGVKHISLALAPALAENGQAYLDAVKKENWIITSTMLHFEHEDYTTLDTIKVTGGVAPDEKWPVILDHFSRAAKITAELNVRYILMHVGFLNHHDTAYAKKFTDRVRALADIAVANNIVLIMETGQESAEEMLQFIESLNHPGLALNIDPANLILYNTDEPVSAVKKIARYVRHVHAKDARRTTTPGTWGQEVPWGDGEVNTDAFLRALDAVGFAGAITVEREAGTQRVADVTQAIERLSNWKKQEVLS